MTQAPLAEVAVEERPRFRPGWELLLVLGVSLGESAAYSVLSLADKLTRGTPLNQQTTTITSSVAAERPWLDLSYQIANLVFPLVPALLALYLLRLTADRRRIGFDLRRPWFDFGWGWALTAGIGIPGLALYFTARAIGINTNVAPANLAANWWTVPVLIGVALMNGILEEVVMIGFWYTRTKQLNWPLWTIVLGSALVRGSYHLYQGFGGFIGNVVMGAVFGLVYLKTKRIGPLVVAHVILDLFSFVGYALIAPYVSWI